jgi:hypothetical protein
VQYSESETLMATLQGWVPGEQRPPEAVIIRILSSAQVPPRDYGVYILFTDLA